MKKPYGVGDLLWVKETFWQLGYCVYPGLDENGEWLGNMWINVYRLNGNSIIRYCESNPEMPTSIPKSVQSDSKWKKKPSLFMSKDDSRILLEVTAVKESRLQDITEQEAISEGIEVLSRIIQVKYRDYRYNPNDYCLFDPRKSFSTLWDSINGKKKNYKWESNPEVFMYQFKVLSVEHKATQHLLKIAKVPVHPILFNKEMIIAILKKIKTQTTRIKGV
jgi:hypothetical protein